MSDQQRRLIAEITRRLELASGVTPVEAASALEPLLAIEPNVEWVTVVVGGITIGTSSRSRVATLSPGGTRGIGDRDGAMLPGELVRYSLLLYRCAICIPLAYRVHVEELGEPQCEQGHGPMVRSV